MPTAEVMMLEVGFRSNDNIAECQEVADVDERASDWELVLRESHHRMKNTLTLLGASVRRDFLRARPAEVSIAVDRFERRIAAFGSLYRLLSDDPDLKSVSIEEFFESLCVTLSEAILEPAGIRCDAAIGSGTLPASKCHRLALMVTELVTNAAKHAFPNKNGGLIRIEVRYREGSWYCTVADNGTSATGPLQGTGGRLLGGLARSIRAQVHGEAGQGGTSVTIVTPASGTGSAP
jgi:two-component sensor histidine kinase